MLMERVTVSSGRQAEVLDARRGSTIPPESSDLDPPQVGIGNLNTPYRWRVESISRWLQLPRFAGMLTLSAAQGKAIPEHRETEQGSK